MHKTTIIVRELRHIHSGNTRGGQPYEIQQVIATKVDGTPIDKNLRTFDKLPKHEPIEVTVEKFESEHVEGMSYTIKPAAKSGGVGKSIDELRSRIERIEQHIGLTTSPGSAAPSAPPPPPTPPPPPPTQEPPPPAPEALPDPPQAAPPPDDDIPF